MMRVVLYHIPSSLHPATACIACVAAQKILPRLHRMHCSRYPYPIPYHIPYTERRITNSTMSGGDREDVADVAVKADSPFVSSGRLLYSILLLHSMQDALQTCQRENNLLHDSTSPSFTTFHQCHRRRQCIEEIKQ